MDAEALKKILEELCSKADAAIKMVDGDDEDGESDSENTPEEESSETPDPEMEKRRKATLMIALRSKK
jgi:hypothetical protein